MEPFELFVALVGRVRWDVVFAVLVSLGLSTILYRFDNLFQGTRDALREIRDILEGIRDTLQEIRDVTYDE